MANYFLAKGLEQLNIYSSQTEKKLTEYMDEILRFNPSLGLVGLKKTGDKAEAENELVIRHVLDSLAPVSIIKKFFPNTESRGIADVGSGAGFPGIPLGIALPDVKVSLLEKMGRRINFLLGTVSALNLNNIEVIEGDVKNAAKKFPSDYSIVTCRAYQHINDEMLHTFNKLLADSGAIILYKGKHDNIKKELSLCKTLNAFQIELINYSVPFLDEERNLVVVKKAMI
jgi:16S rRNA (guanine527-N7)-methyltransferase